MIVPNFQISAKFPEQPPPDSSKKLRNQNDKYDSDYEYSSSKQQKLQREQNKKI